MKNSIDGGVKTAFVVGLPRSGTTLLTYLLAGGGNVLSLSEPFLSRAVRRHRLLDWLYFPKVGGHRISPPENADEQAFWAYLENFCRDLGFTALLIKETYRLPPILENTALLDRIAGNSVPMIAITRHPYDAATSMLRLFRQLRGTKGRLMRLFIAGFPAIPEDLEAVEWFARNWASFALWCKAKSPSVVRYESLVRDPAAYLPALCEHCQLSYSDTMLDNSHLRSFSGMSGDPGRLNQHKKNLYVRPVGVPEQLPPDFRDVIRKTCGEAAEELDYAL